ncbi:MAG TPA: PilZ domain-containing protein [Polyangia bacterium]|nr:PilZ domain-containing protein [Polyangia bacterium]
MPKIISSNHPEILEQFGREFLRRREIRLIVARSGREAMHVVREDKPDLVLLGRVMPDIDAFEVVRAIRRDAELRNLPVVLVTSWSYSSGPDEAKKAGFTDLLRLPSSRGEVGQQLARLLGVRQREAERFPVRLRVSADGFGGSTVNLSSKGMLVRAKHRGDVGDVVVVGFTLPGSGEKLELRARVVRIDPDSYAPAVGLGLAFEALKVAEQAALEQFSAQLLAGRTLTWNLKTSADGATVVHLYGALREDSDLAPLAEALRGQVTFNMRDFHRISSDCVQNWINFTRGLERVSKVHLVEMPVPFVNQANLVSNLLDRCEVVSFYAPYLCEHCGIDDERLIEVSALDRLAPAAPAFVCASCAQPMSFDEIEERYFGFLMTG